MLSSRHTIPHSEGHHLVTQIDNGDGTVVLSDGSQWRVSSADQPILQGWCRFEEVELRDTDVHHVALWHTRRQQTITVERLR